MKPIRTVAEMGRAAEHGRIRTGEKVQGRKGLEPRAIPNFRFTTPDRSALDALAAKYGGTPRPWDDPSAAVRDQWELYTEAAEIDVLLPPDALSIWYETWSSAGCLRRCDGDVCSVPSSDPNDGDRPEFPCLCNANNLRTCKAKTRLSVVLPEPRFAGVWRYESGSDYVAEEMSGIEPLIQGMQGGGRILLAKLVLEKRTRKREGKTRHFQVTKLILESTPQELASGQGTLVGIPVRSEQQALGTGKIEEGEGAKTLADHETDGSTPIRAASDGDSGISPSSLDDEILDAELIDDGPSGNGQPYGIEDDMTDPTAGMTDDEKAWETSLDLLEVKTQLDRKVLVRAICLSATDGFGERVKDLTPEGWMLAVQRAEDLTKPGITVTGVTDDGRLKVKRS